MINVIQLLPVASTAESAQIVSGTLPVDISSDANESLSVIRLPISTVVFSAKKLEVLYPTAFSEF